MREEEEFGDGHAPILRESRLWREISRPFAADSAVSSAQEPVLGLLNVAGPGRSIEARGPALKSGRRCCSECAAPAPRRRPLMKARVRFPLRLAALVIIPALAFLGRAR